MLFSHGNDQKFSFKTHKFENAVWSEDVLVWTAKTEALVNVNVIHIAWANNISAFSVAGGNTAKAVIGCKASQAFPVENKHRKNKKLLHCYIK